MQTVFYAPIFTALVAVLLHWYQFGAHMQARNQHAMCCHTILKSPLPLACIPSSQQRLLSKDSSNLYPFPTISN